ncbi:MAG: ABC transporter substrate-binding protein, partial [Clostridia bacterium]|nr:ABC transporter substrate-binding protein [Clostridia bacterium]
MKKILALILALLTLSAALVGCAAANTTDAPKSPSPEESGSVSAGPSKTPEGEPSKPATKYDVNLAVLSGST